MLKFSELNIIKRWKSKVSAAENCLLFYCDAGRLHFELQKPERMSIKGGTKSAQDLFLGLLKLQLKVYSMLYL